MKPTPGRLDAARYPRHLAVPIRFADIDMFRHLNNVAAGQFYEEARYALVGEARALLPREDRTALVVANVDTAFLRQARYPGTIDVATGVAELRARSFVIAQGLFLDGQGIGLADTVVVAMDATGRACVLPEPIERFLRGFVLEPEG